MPVGLMRAHAFPRERPLAAGQNVSARVIFTRPDGAIIPNCPPLPHAHGDLSSQHTAHITPDTIGPAGLADKFDLDFSIWACFANARIAEERREAHAQELAA